MVIINPDKSFEIKTNIFDFVFGRQLIQRDKKRRPHFITFFSKKLYKPEFNYPIYNKELMAIIKLFKEWKPYFNGTKY